MSLNPDIALLQESIYPNRQVVGYHFEWAPAYQNKSWGSMVLSRWPLTKFDLAALEPQLRPLIDSFSGQVVGATIRNENNTEVLLASIHTPAKTVPKSVVPASILPTIKLKLNRQIWRADVVYGALRRLPEIYPHFLFGGDWNTSRLFDVIHGPRGNQEFFDRMRESGFVDCWRVQHAAEVRTWYQEGDAHFQLDHVFCDPRTASLLRASKVDPIPAESGLSDHAILVFDFDGVQVLKQPG